MIRLFFRVSMIVGFFLALFLQGCAMKQHNGQVVEDAVVIARPDITPMLVWSDMESTLKCLGDGLRKARTQPVLLGYNVSDTTGKTGVDQGLLMHAAMNKIPARANGFAVTSYGSGPSAPNRLTSPQLDLILRDPVALANLRKPDMTMEGGVISVDAAFMSDNKRIGIATRDFKTLTDSASVFLDFRSYSS